jgi:NADH:ubiquinone oxidoreductase subunit 2 (subunit N)
MMMYMREPSGTRSIAQLSPTTMTLLGLTALGTLYMGIFPGSVLHLAARSVHFLF